MDNISSSRGGSSAFLFNKGSMKFNLNDQKVLKLKDLSLLLSPLERGIYVSACRCFRLSVRLSVCLCFPLWHRVPWGYHFPMLKWWKRKPISL